MPSKDEKTVLLREALGLSETTPSVTDKSVLQSQQVGRGPSVVAPGGDVIMHREDLGQGAANVIDLKSLTGDTALYKGDTTILSIGAENLSNSVVKYTANFKENGGEFTEVVKNIPGQETVYFEASRTKSDPGCFNYQVNDSNVLEVCWLNVRPGSLQADPLTVYTKGNDLSTTLSIDVQVPSSEGSSYDVTIDFVEDDTTTLKSTTKTISPGSTASYSTSQGYSDPQTHVYHAKITVEDTGRSVKSNDVTVKWTDKAAGAIRLEPLRAPDYILQTGDRGFQRIVARNEYTEAIDYTLDFSEDGSDYQSITLTIDGADSTSAQAGARTYETTRTKTSAGKFEYQAADPDDINVSNTMTQTWLLIAVGQLQADPVTLKPGNTSTVSIQVENTTSSTETIRCRFEENGAEIANQLQEVAAGSTYTFSVDVTESTEVTNAYQAFITGPAGIEAPSGTQQVVWTEDAAAAGTIDVKVDNFYRVYVNGYFMGSRMTGSHEDWNQFYTQDADSLVTGKNVVAVVGYNSDGSDGPFVNYEEVETQGLTDWSLSNPNFSVDPSSVDSLKTTRSPGAGWTQVGYDDSGWNSISTSGEYWYTGSSQQTLHVDTVYSRGTFYI